MTKTTLDQTASNTNTYRDYIVFAGTEPCPTSASTDDQGAVDISDPTIGRNGCNGGSPSAQTTVTCHHRLDRVRANEGRERDVLGVYA